ncbi:uncharacterized protein [Miscanthus floridulus]|uniref:uncharacterized protein n=1 Tax=Miscanthus floridulus TaxID=154761 RepID=UPI00345AAE18
MAPSSSDACTPALSMKLLVDTNAGRVLYAEASKGVVDFLFSLLTLPVGTGFVQGLVTYTVMDDLKVTPMSTISGITLLNTFGITDIGTLKEKTVQLGYEEGLEILRVALQSKTVLTDVFLGKKRKA